MSRPSQPADGPEARGDERAARLGVALVGAGFIGPLHAANVAAHPRCALDWVVDVDAAAAARVALRHGARATANLDEALADPAVGAVIVCTPPRTHGDIVIRAARAGKAIFCEKPIDLDLARVDACEHVLRDTGVPCFVAFNRRFDPTHRALRDAIAGGRIGKVEMLLLSSRDPEISPPEAVAATPWGIFYDTLIHDFDMLRYLLDDEPVEIFARADALLGVAENPLRDPDTAMVVLTMAKGTLVHVNASFRAVYGYDQRIEAFGERGMLVSGNQRATTLERHDAAGTHVEPLLHFFVDRYVASYRAELDAFVAALDAGTPPPVTLEDGRRALVLAAAGVQSARTGLPVRLATPSAPAAR